MQTTEVLTKRSVNCLSKVTIFLKKIVKDFKLSRLSAKAEMGNWGNGMSEIQIIRVEIRVMQWECWCRESVCECKTSGWKFKKCGESEWTCRESR